MRCIGVVSAHLHLLRLFVDVTNGFAMSNRTEGGVEDPADALRAELRRLSNAVSHLERSNRELVDANAQCEDEEYVSAIRENVEVIARMRQQVRD